MITEVQNLLKDSEGFLIKRKENKLYLSGLAMSGGSILITKNCSYLILPGKYINLAKVKNISFEVIEAEEHSLLEKLNDILLEKKLTTLKFEGNHISYNFFKKLENLNVNLESCDEILEKLRETKNDFEQKLIEYSCEIAEKAIENAIINLEEGMSERKLADLIEMEAKNLGAEAIEFLIVASGKNGAFPHIRPTDKKILKGELITIDFGVIYRGYHSDITRTYALGDITLELKKIYDIVYEAQKFGLSLVKPGISSKDLDKKVRDFISERGFGEYFTHGLGHGIGLDGHESPILNKNNKIILRENMVLTIEPGIYIPDLGGVRIEDTLVVTRDGYELLTKSSKKLKKVGKYD